jgi:hypothetical protein
MRLPECPYVVFVVGALPSLELHNWFQSSPPLGVYWAVSASNVALAWDHRDGESYDTRQFEDAWLYCFQDPKDAMLFKLRWG